MNIKVLNNYFKYVLVFCMMIIVALGLLYLVALIPNEKIYDNILESAQIMQKDGEEFYQYSNGRYILMHNYTDAIMLNTIYSIDNNNILESIIKCRRNYVPGVTQEILGEKNGNLVNYVAKENENKETEIVREYFMVKDLIDTINREPNPSYEYARYWHGYITILKPMLLLFNITQIRIIFLIAVILLLLLLGYYIHKNVNNVIAIFTILIFFCFDILAFSKNIQGVLVMIIALASSVFIANKKINEKNINITLLIIGGLTAYFDFLTTPLITILLPITIYFMIYKKNNIKILIKDIIIKFIIWGIGYVGIWASKWVMNDIIYNSGLIKLSIEQVVFRINSKEIVGTKNVPVRAVTKNILFSINTLNLLIIIVCIAYSIINYKKVLKSYKIAYLILFFIPLLWYVVFSNHSCQHYLFTYKLLIINLLCLTCIVFDNDTRDIIDKKLFYTLIILAIIIYIIIFSYNCINHIKGIIISEKNNEYSEMIDEKILEEQNIYDELMSKEYENQSSKEPYLFYGFSYVEGTWDTGYVIQDESGNQYVWVPCGNKSENDIVKLERENSLDLPFINYTDCYNERYEEFLKSTLENGGFYISRYELGKEGEKPVSKNGIEVWSNITFEEAEDIVDKMYTDIKCELINGYAYDTTQNWIEKNNEIEIEDNIIKIEKDGVIYSGRKSANNIYDFCDNVLEFSLENLYNTKVIRGFINSDNEIYADKFFSIESRYCIMSKDKYFGNITPITIRTVLYK